MNNQNISPDESAASLAFATKLSEGLLGGQHQNAPQTPETAPRSEKAPETPNTPPQPDMEGLMAKFELNITKQLDSLRKEFKEDTQKEIEGIKQDLKQALQDEDNEETKTKKTSK